MLQPRENFLIRLARGRRVAEWGSFGDPPEQIILNFTAA